MHSRRQFISDSLRHSLKAAVVSGGLFTSLSLRAKAELFGQIPSDMPSDRSIYRLEGEVKVNGVRADIDTFIPANALVETGKDALIIFIVGEDAHILRANSEVQLNGQGVVESGMKVITGKILSVFGKRKKAEKIVIQSSTATIGIRGTGVYVESESERSYICTCYGIADIEALYGQEAETVATTHHDDPRFVYRQSGSKFIQKAPLINHTDEELALIEALVGRVPPFPNFSDSYGNKRRTY